MNSKMMIGKEVWHDLESRGLIDAIREENESAFIYCDYSQTKTTSNVVKIWINLTALKAVLVECRITISNLEDAITSDGNNSEERSWLAKWRRAQNKFNTELSYYGIKQEITQ